MTKIYLIRHGESEWNKIGKIQGQKDTMLTNLGREQARLLGNKLKSEDIDTIYTSDLKRAYETADIISNVIKKPLISNESLREINFGVWEGLTIDEIRKRYENDYLLWNKEPHKLNIEGAESLDTLQERAINYINEIIEDNKNIAIVSHGAILKTIILGLLDIDLSSYKKITLNNLSLSIVNLKEFNNVLTLLNDISHLKGLSV